jgi:hypothetical protein
MATSQTQPLPTAAGEPARAPGPAVIHGGEALLLAAILGIGLLAWAGLALADAGRYSLPAAVALAVAATAAVAVLAWRARGRPRLVADRAGLAALAGVALVAAVLFLPGFAYGIGKDPGAYVGHAIAIARLGSSTLQDPVLDRARVPTVAVTPEDPAGRFPAIWIDDRSTQRVVLQFYHLWPALLASAFTAGGYTGLVNLTPVCGVLAVLAVTMAARRVLGLLGGSLAGLLLAANMLEVWHAKYPSNEVFTQLLIGGALLGMVIALQTGWRPAAGMAGLLLGLSYLARPDSLLLLLLAVAAGCVLIVGGRFDGRAGWFMAGLAITLPYGFLQAYVLARRYTLANSVPDFPVVAALIAGALAAAVLLRRAAPALGRWVLRLLRERRFQLRAGTVVAGMAAMLLVLGLLRPWLSGPVYGIFNGRRVRTYDEASMIRLSWFFTLPGLGLGLAGLALAALRRWRAAAWTLVLPAVCLLPVYAYRADIASRLMWWTRRFVPIIVPGLVVLIAAALAAGLGVAAGPGWRRWSVRVASAAAAIFLLAVFAGQSLPLRHHQEHGGSFEAVQRIARAAGDRQGVFLWEQGGGLYNNPAYAFGGAVWLQQGQVSALLPARPDPAYARSFVRGFPGQPVFLVARGHQPPRGYGSLALRLAERFTYVMPVWEETYLTRPSKALAIPIPISIWRVEGT